MQYEEFIKEFSGLIDKMSCMISDEKTKTTEPDKKTDAPVAEKISVKAEPVVKKPEHDRKYITIQVDDGDPDTAVIVCNSAFSGQDADTYVMFAMSHAMAKLIAKSTCGNEIDVEDIYDDIINSAASYSVRKLIDLFKEGY